MIIIKKRQKIRKAVTITTAGQGKLHRVQEVLGKMPDEPGCQSNIVAKEGYVALEKPQ